MTGPVEGKAAGAVWRRGQGLQTQTGSVIQSGLHRNALTAFQTFSARYSLAMGGRLGDSTAPSRLGGPNTTGQLLSMPVPCETMTSFGR